MSLTARTMTADELLHMPDDGMRHELILGELKTMTLLGFLHGVTVACLGSRLWQAVAERKLGLVFAVGGFWVERNPDTVLAPDLAFVRRERVATTGLPEGYFPGAPDLAVEVVSPEDSASEMRARAHAWLTHGAEEVWVVNPRTRTVAIHRVGSRVAILTDEQIVESPALLPGFSCAVRELFAFPT